MEYNFPDHVSGDTFDGLQFTVIVNGTPVNLKSVVFAMAMKLDAKDADKIKFSSEDDDGMVIVDAEQGKFAFPQKKITAKPEKWFYNITYIDINDVEKTYISGRWPIGARI